jgi:hypothetical protein
VSLRPQRLASVRAAQLAAGQALLAAAVSKTTIIVRPARQAHGPDAGHIA